MIDSADIPERVWRMMPPADQKALGHDPGAAAKALVLRERKEQKLFNAWLNIKMRERALYPINPRSDKATTILKGHPDYTIFLPGARMLLLEMKMDGGVFSKDQIGSIELLTELGFIVEIPHSHNEAVDLVRKYL